MAISERVQQMDREDLEDLVVTQNQRLRDLESRVEQVEQDKANETLVQYAVAMIADELTDAEIDFTADPHAHKKHFGQIGENIQNLTNTVQRHDSLIEEHGTPSADSKSKAWKDTVEAAQNLQGTPDHDLREKWVKLYTENIKQATGYTKRRAGQLIDEWSDEKEGTDMVPYKRITTSRKTESANIQRKALKIDLSVWGDD